MSANTDNRGKKPKEQIVATLKKLLGSLELQVMEFMWQTGEATVQQVVKTIKRRRPIAYTTVMTVMGHSVDKGLLARTMEGKRYRYQIARSRDEFLLDSSRNMIHTLVDDFGDLAIAQFLGEIDNIDAGKLEELRSQVQEASNESDVSR